MEEIIFKGPFHISELDNESKTIGRNKDKKLDKIKPGIYIWGFVTATDLKHFKNFNHFLEKNETPKFDDKVDFFIPYYIGLDSNLFNRIKNHKDFENHDAMKYTRMSEDYMLRFFKDSDDCDKNYPIKIGNKDIHKRYLKINESEGKINVLYYNNSDFLTETYGKECILNNQTKTEIPITKFNNDNNNIIKDTLKEMFDDTNLTDHKNNLWFCYAELVENTDFVKCKLLDFETLTYYSLKGKTISKTEEFETISENIQIKCNDNLINIFKEKILNKEIIKEKYLNEKNQIKFEGYIK